jgi:hypothetical protein
MAIAIHHEGGNTYRLDIRGTLRKADLDRCQNELVGHLKHLGTVRLLFVLEGFDGWDNRDNWSDMSFYVRHGDAIERIAIVGPEKWRSETMMFAAADLRKGPVEFFVEPHLADARTWLAG